LNILTLHLHDLVQYQVQVVLLLQKAISNFQINGTSINSQIKSTSIILDMSPLALPPSTTVCARAYKRCDPPSGRGGKAAVYCMVSLPSNVL